MNKGSNFVLSSEEEKYYEDVSNRYCEDYSDFHKDNETGIYRPSNTLGYLKEFREREGVQPTIPTTPY
ncbi:hypothetical protein LK994_13540 [Ferruginibacter lapsinanis]|uniref:hypothetical protein n=1 Tax=Ferruginibacter lapsinanis TaxID=563172 RepID=UPI001E2C4BC1|nr:hypothetical protein [Ferruginibacter lapsinanis]UEG49660.1 hypothetical protein LK994_13540 [Ferruginibacter lapsinanis]